jgi:hypothetical protein
VVVLAVAVTAVYVVRGRVGVQRLWRIAWQPATSEPSDDRVASDDTTSDATSDGDGAVRVDISVVVNEDYCCQTTSDTVD